MREFWVASGHHLTRLDPAGRMAVTDELLLAWFARPEVLPPAEACFAERALHARLLRDHSLVAIGGIDEARFAQVLPSGVGSVAVVRAIVGAPDPVAAAQRLMQRMNAALD